ncbi:MAG: hypothetical protein VW447_11930, partial [Limnobacter sp.]
MYQSKWRIFTNHTILILGSLFMIMPVWIAFASSTHTREFIFQNGLQFWPGGHMIENYGAILFDPSATKGRVTALEMLFNSMVLGLGFAIGKVIISMMAAYAIVYFRFKLAVPLFWVIFSTLLLPLEVRIVDGAGPIRFFIDILAPLSVTMIAAIFIIMFVVGWNQYLWPLLMTTDDQLYTIVIGIKQVYNSLYEGGQIPQFPKAFALTVMATIPPVLVVVIFQRMFIKGLVET